MAQQNDTTGLTRDAGWEVGVRTTVSAALPAVWDYLIGAGLPLWLGETTLPSEKNAVYETDDGVRGRLISRTERVRVRLSWRPADWPHDTTLQLSVRAAATGTTVALHHERLADRDERRMMLGHWKTVVGELEKAIAAL
jgi:hypothetical protein